MRKLINKLNTICHTPNWLAAVLAGVLLLRIPSLFEPYSYGDEMIYVTLGNAVRRGLTLYKDIHDNKPPLLYYTAAIAGNLFWFKVILLLWSLVTVYLFWKLTTKLFKDQELLQKIATIIFAILTTIPLLEGNIVNSELFMIGPIIAAFLILLSSPTNKKIFIGGILLGIATLFKIPAAFDAPAIVFYWLITTGLNRNLIKKTIILLIGFALSVLITFVWYYFKGALGEYWVAAFMQNVGYISSWHGTSGPPMSQPFLIKNASLIMRAWIVIMGLILLKVYQKRLSPTFTFASIWLLFSLFGATLSERPYPHYLIQIVPSVAILIAILLAAKTIEQVLVIIPLFLAFLAPVYYKFYYYPTFSYYTRFISFATGQTTKDQYFNSFAGNVTTNYKVSQFIKDSTNDNDKIFVWGDSAPIIYALSRRLPVTKYAATYHIQDFSNQNEVLSQLSKNPPVFIVIEPNSPAFPGLESFASKNYLPIQSDTKIEVWHLMSSGVKSKIQ